MSPETRKKLPSLNVSPEGYELLESFRLAKGLPSISEAIRQLLQESQRLIDFARENGKDVAALSVSTWGGNRRESTDMGTVMSLTAHELKILEAVRRHDVDKAINLLSEQGGD